MKISYLVVIVSLLLIALGCARNEERRVADWENLYPPSYAGGSSSEDEAHSHGHELGGQAAGNYSSSSLLPGSVQLATPPQSVALLLQVRETLIRDPSVAAAVPRITLSDNNGAITLGGEVASEQQKSSVEAGVRRNEGVVSVNNNLKVASLAASPGSSESPLTPTSEDFGITSRTNAARSIYSGTMTPATAVEGGQAGAVTVNVQGSTETDRTLAQQISEELRADASLASAISQVSISVIDGQVILRGVVRNEVQQREIESAIQRTTGVSSVDNQLRVSLTGSPDNL